LVGSRVAFDRESLPSSVAKRKLLGPDSAPSVMTTAFGCAPLPLLKTMPVGAAGGVPPMGGGMAITRGEPALGNAVPFPRYAVAFPLPLSATIQGPVAL